MLASATSTLIPGVLGLVILVALLIFVRLSVISIGPSQVGLVSKRFGSSLSEGNVVAFDGEAGYQADLLMPGLHVKIWPRYNVEKYPWVQIPNDGIGVVIAQVGERLPQGAKSAAYKSEFEDFRDIRGFTDNGGQLGIQRPVLPPGALVPIHPVGFLVLTSSNTYGKPVSANLGVQRRDREDVSPDSFGINQRDLNVVRIEPDRDGGVDYVGVVTTLEGDPLPSGDIAGRLGGFTDIEAMEQNNAPASEIIDTLLGSMNQQHNNYQDFQAFLDHGGKIGLQHDVLMYGAYLLNPFLVKVERVPMLVVNQGEVAVIKAYVGLSTEDTSGEDFKFGSIVDPGHRGVWSEPLRTGKYAINPRIYSSEIVPTSILTLNWASATSEAHDLDRSLSSIHATSKEGFAFQIDLQVQIHVPDVRAPKVISMVGTMLNLVNEVLQSAVGNYFRNNLQGMAATKFIETREEVQEAAEKYVAAYLAGYEVETKGVYIQDVVLPQQLVDVLSEREIANQQKATYEEQEKAQTSRVKMERARGTADSQAALAQAQVDVEVQQSKASARKAEAEGEAAYIRETGAAEGAKIKSVGEARGAAEEAIGVGRAKGYSEQTAAIGKGPTALVAAVQAIAEGGVDVTPQVLVFGQGGSIDGLAGTLMQYLSASGETTSPEAETPPPARSGAGTPEAPSEPQVAEQLPVARDDSGDEPGGSQSEGSADGA